MLLLALLMLLMLLLLLLLPACSPLGRHARMTVEPLPPFPSLPACLYRQGRKATGECKIKIRARRAGWWNTCVDRRGPTYERLRPGHFLPGSDFSFSNSSLHYVLPTAKLARAWAARLRPLTGRYKSRTSLRPIIAPPPPPPPPPRRFVFCSVFSSHLSSKRQMHDIARLSSIHTSACRAVSGTPCSGCGEPCRSTAHRFRRDDVLWYMLARLHAPPGHCLVLGRHGQRYPFSRLPAFVEGRSRPPCLATKALPA
ncbi:uncharacterized protein PSFLO_00890 [Pseudozyma flocculosa]|uniref:Secreted protein n=1 Tax=Pseudozyma flocculosa TaxID=84751 RepID=A0A5C3EWA2_9BASI|nr:uncharacterized protein PSFLO_00890 [Pseudozyma flocculosa]